MGASIWIPPYLTSCGSGFSGSDAGILPEIRFRERSKSDNSYMFEIELGMVLLIWFPLSKALLSIPSLPKL